MSFQHEYRPRNFDEFLGNKITVKTLISNLNKQDRPQAFLFGGPSRCGKTTLARLAADYIGCSAAEFRELNAANVRGIDTVRSVIEEAVFAPLMGEIKVYLFDEAAQLTKDAQTAMFKFLEDPPSHVYIMLATTDPDKIQAPLRKRCHPFYVTLVSPAEIVELVNWILASEGKKLKKEVIDRIAEASDGAPGTAALILDQVIDLPFEDAMKAIERIRLEEHQVIDLCRAIIKRAHWSEVARIVEALEQDPESIRRAILGYLGSALLKAKTQESTRIAEAMLQFKSNLYDTGKPGLVLQCFQAVL